MARNSNRPGNTPEPTHVGDVQPINPFQRMLRRWDMEAELETEQDRFSGDDLTAILDAEDEEAMWDASERVPFNSMHLAGCQLELRDVTIKYSRGNSTVRTPFVGADDRKMYLLVTAVRISDKTDKREVRLPKVGEVFQFNTSARQLCAQIDWLVMHRRIHASEGISALVEMREIDLGDGTSVSKLRKLEAPPTVRATVEE